MIRKKNIQILSMALAVSLLLMGCAASNSAATALSDESVTTQDASGDAGHIENVLTEIGNADDSLSAEALKNQGTESGVSDDSLSDEKVSDAEAEKKARADAEAELLSHVKGIKHFTTVEGKHPDVMAGVTWDDTIAEVTSNADEINWDLPDVYQLTYTVTAKDGRTAKSSIDIEVYLDLEHYLYGMEGAVYIPVDGTFDPMEHVVTEPEIETIEPDTSALDTSKEGEYLISYKLTAPGGRFQTAVRKVTVGEEPQDTGFGTGYGTGEGPAVIESVEGYSTVTDLGLWRLTAYMDTPADQGPYVGQTASGAPLVAGRTVAVSSATCARLGLEFGDRLMVDGHVYVLEDHGGSAMYDSDWLDIYVDNEADEYSDAFNRYAEVYLLR